MQALYADNTEIGLNSKVGTVCACCRHIKLICGVLLGCVCVLGDGGGGGCVLARIRSL
jgi:hypothetical protein